MDTHIAENYPECMIAKHLRCVAMLAVSFTYIPGDAQHMNEKDSPCAAVVVTADLSRCLAKARDSADAKNPAAASETGRKKRGS